MSKQRKKHSYLVIERKYKRYFSRAMEHDIWLMKSNWKSNLVLNRKRWK